MLSLAVGVVIVVVTLPSVSGRNSGDDGGDSDDMWDRSAAS
jgi:hypothetical protein